MRRLDIILFILLILLVGAVTVYMVYRARQVDNIRKTIEYQTGTITRDAL